MRRPRYDDAQVAYPVDDGVLQGDALVVIAVIGGEMDAVTRAAPGCASIIACCVACRPEQQAESLVG